MESETTRIISGKPSAEDTPLDTNLRPRHLTDFIGQDKIKGNLNIAIAAARARGEGLDHILLYGPPGLGKTTLDGSTLSHSWHAGFCFFFCWSSFKTESMFILFQF